MSQTARRRTASVVGVLGEVLITVGVLFLLVVVYDLWWTNLVSGRAAEQERSELISSWETDILPERGEPPAQVTPSAGQPLGLMYLPRLRDKVWGLPIIEGVSDRDLARGLGRLPQSAVPGTVGNFAVAGHRATNGEPLRDVDQLVAGDLVYVQTEFGWYTYRLTRTQLVAPTDVWVAAPNPFEAGAPPTRALLTLVTCHPRWGSSQRWVWWGEQIETRNRAEGPPPALVAEGVTG